jgi:hypothetical protein
MPRGRPAIPKSATKYLNTKRRVIYQTAEGKFIVKSDKGATVYNPKARFVKSPGGSTRTITNSNGRIPTAIRPKAVRKVRADRGKARPKPGQVYRSPIGPRRMVGRPRKARGSPMGNMGIAALFGGRPVRKQRANKGAKRGARVGKKLLGKNPFAGLM